LSFLSFKTCLKVLLPQKVFSNKPYITLTQIVSLWPQSMYFNSIFLSHYFALVVLLSQGVVTVCEYECVCVCLCPGGEYFRYHS
jgi:hypothetical protein